MNIRQTLLAVITVMFLATGNAWAHENGDMGSDKSFWFSRSTLVHFWQHKLNVLHHKVHAWRNKVLHTGTKTPIKPSGPVYSGGTRGVAPEIDAASGTSAIALLTGVLLLAGERSRSRRVCRF